SHAIAIGCCTSGSAAKTVALKPGGSRIFAAASVAGIGPDLSGSELYGAGNSDARKLSNVSNDSSSAFTLMRIERGWTRNPLTLSPKGARESARSNGKNLLSTGTNSLTLVI